MRRETRWLILGMCIGFGIVAGYIAWSRRPEDRKLRSQMRHAAREMKGISRTDLFEKRLRGELAYDFWKFHSENNES